MRIVWCNLLCIRVTTVEKEIHMSMTRVEVLFEVYKQLSDGEKICYQSCIYHHGTVCDVEDFRFMRRDAGGKLKAQRGQAGAKHEDFMDLVLAMRRLLNLPAKMFTTKTSWEYKEFDLIEAKIKEEDKELAFREFQWSNKVFFNKEDFPKPDEEEKTEINMKDALPSLVPRM